MYRYILIVLAFVWAGAGMAAEAVDTVSAGDQEFADIAVAPGGESVVVWARDEQDGNLSSVYMRRFGASGTPIAAPVQVNQAVMLRQTLPKVAMNARGESIVVWLSEHELGPGVGVFARRYGPNGAPLGDEFKLDEDNGASVAPGIDVDIAADGRAVAVWSESQGVAGLAALENTSIRARLIGANGELGATVGESGNSLPVRRVPAVAINDDGAFVIAWHVDSDSELSKGIFQRRYQADGRSLGFRPTRVSPVRSAAAVDSPTVITDAEDGFWVGWSAYVEDSSPQAALVRHFGADGQAIGPPISIDAGLSQPALALDTAGQLVVASQDDGIRLHRVVDGQSNALSPVAIEPAFGLLFPALGVSDADVAQVVWQAFGVDGDARGIFRESVALPR